LSEFGESPSSGWLGRAFSAGSAQHRSLEEVQDGLFLDAGNRREKGATFWVLLVLATVIAAGGVITNSTATVVGAMIIAPLGTPIFGAALAVAAGYERRLLGALAFLVLGIAVAVAIGAIIGRVFPMRMPLSINPQVTGRTSPAILDLVVAVATGVVGAYGLTRRDVAAVLPGVAIAISLVPPLAVVGITAGAGQFHLALGALLLFLSNVIAILVAGVAVFALSGYRQEAHENNPRLRRRAVWIIAAVLLALLVPLGLSSLRVIQYNRWIDTSTTATQNWLRGTGWTLDSVEVEGTAIRITVTGEGTPGSIGQLRSAVRGVVPATVPVLLIENEGTEVGI